MKGDLVIGVDIGGTRTKAGLVNIATGEVIHCMIQPTEKRDAHIFLEQMNDVIRHFKEIAAMKESSISTIGFGVPGFTRTKGIVETTYGFLEFMENYPLKEIIENEFSLQCCIDNDARVVSMGEALYGKGKGYSRVLTLTLGTGVGFGFVVNGKFSDEFPLSHMGGHITITDEGGECYCGKKGCLEALVSSSGIISLAKNINGLNGEISAETIFTAATDGNAEAGIIIEKIAGYLNTAIHNYINLFAPDMIVLGGGIAKGLAPYLEKIKGNAYLRPYPDYTFQLTLSELEEWAGMLGSAALFNATAQKTVVE